MQASGKEWQSIAGPIDEAVFKAKSADLKAQIEEAERQLDEADQFDPAFGQAALAAFEFSQNLVSLWRGSNSAARREILECVSLNRLLTDTSLVLEKRRPFDFLAERPFFENTRGDWIRTSDFVLPKHALCQAELRPGGWFLIIPG